MRVAVAVRVKLRATWSETGPALASSGAGRTRCLFGVCLSFWTWRWKLRETRLSRNSKRTQGSIFLRLQEPIFRAAFKLFICYLNLALPSSEENVQLCFGAHHGDLSPDTPNTKSGPGCSVGGANSPAGPGPQHSSSGAAASTAAEWAPKKDGNGFLVSFGACGLKPGVGRAGSFQRKRWLCALVSAPGGCRGPQCSWLVGAPLTSVLVCGFPWVFSSPAF